MSIFSFLGLGIIECRKIITTNVLLLQWVWDLQTVFFKAFLIFYNRLNQPFWCFISPSQNTVPIAKFYVRERSRNWISNSENTFTDFQTHLLFRRKLSGTFRYPHHSIKLKCTPNSDKKTSHIFCFTQRELWKGFYF